MTLANWLRKKLDSKPLKMYEDLLWRFFMRGQDMTVLKIRARRLERDLESHKAGYKTQKEEIKDLNKFADAIKHMDVIWESVSQGMAHDWREIDDAGLVLNRRIRSVTEDVEDRDRWLKNAYDDRMMVVDALRAATAIGEKYAIHRDVLIEAVKSLEGWACDGFVSWSLVDKQTMNDVAHECHNALVTVGECEEHDDVPF